ncbi:hypothetical protein [Kitasatospora sp. NPDC091207]|uniref:hypothetical protein n=1 Tax=Kitasatospora sp. NPDC091207 TaxID=3364083 RepID=UPI00382681F5
MGGFVAVAGTVPADRRPDRRPRALPVTVTGVVAVVATAAGPGFGLLPFYSAGPALAAARGTVTTVLGTGALPVGLCLGAAGIDHLLGHTRVVIALGGIVVVSAAACYVSSVRRRAERDLVDVREVAEAVQNVVAPPLPSRLGPVALTGSYRSATRAARVAGDLCQAFEAPEGMRVIVAEVQGKGLDALHTAALVLHTFRDTARTAEDLGGGFRAHRGDPGFIGAVHQPPDDLVDQRVLGHRGDRFLIHHDSSAVTSRTYAIFRTRSASSVRRSTSRCGW